MLYQPNAHECVTNTDDVTHRTLCCQTDIHIKNIGNQSVLLRII